MGKHSNRVYLYRSQNIKRNLGNYKIFVQLLIEIFCV